MLSDLLFRLRALVRGSKVERELDEELRSHLEHEIEKYIKAGVSQPEAARRAHLALGGLEQVKERCRDVRGTRVIDDFSQDLRYAFRLLRRSPAFALSALVSLSLGVGAVTAVFSVINAVWLKPLPVAEPSRVVRVYSQRAANVSAPDMSDFRNATKTLKGLVGFAPTAFSVTVGDVPTRVFGELVSGDYFDVLGIRAAKGRTFLPQEGRNPGSAPVLVISQVCWQRTFAGDPAIVGRDVRVNGVPFVVIGVLAAEVRGMLPPLQSDIWVPLTMEPILKPGSKVLENRDAGRFHLLGRLQPGASVAQAQAELTSIARHLEQRHPETNRERTVSVYPARPLMAGFETPVLAFTGFLMALATGLLLTAGVNIGSLLLARATERRAENGLRLALGATRWRLVRQHLVESLLLAGAGADRNCSDADAAGSRASDTSAGGTRRQRRRHRRSLCSGWRSFRDGADGSGARHALIAAGAHHRPPRPRRHDAIRRWPSFAYGIRRGADCAFGRLGRCRRTTGPKRSRGRALGPRISTKRHVGAQRGPRDTSVLTRARASVSSKRPAGAGRCSWRRASQPNRNRSADAIGHGCQPAALRHFRNSDGVVACIYEYRLARLFRHTRHSAIGWKRLRCTRH